MSKMSDFLEQALVNHVLRSTPMPSPSQVYLALFTSDPTDAGTGTEVGSTGTGYERQAITFTVPVDGTTGNDSLVSFPVATTAWGTITHLAIYDSLIGGNMLLHGPVTPTHTVNASARIEVPAGAIQISFL